MEPKEKASVSKSLLQALAQLKEDEMTSRSLIAALEGTATGELVSFKDHFKLPDLVSTEGGDQTSQQEKKLLKPPQQLVSRPQKYICMHFNKEKIKIEAAIQREEQRRRAEEALQLEEDVELTQDEVKDKQCKEQRKKEQAERYECRIREKEGQHEEEEEGQETGEMEAVMESKMQPKGSSRSGESRNPCRSKRKTEQVHEQLEEDEDEDEDKAEEPSRKKKIGCINPREAEEFQGFIQNKIQELVEELKSNKELINPVRKFIRALKLRYDEIHLFENNSATDTEDIVGTIPDTKGIAWRKALDRKEVVDAEEYNKIVDCCMESRLFQEGTLHLELDEMVFGEETDEVKECIMQKCASLFENVEKAHQANLSIAQDLKDLANIVKEPKVFSKIAQAAT